ncbi:hypothetical protein GCM10022251_57290 [Phytohabitans flavus]|uniref:Uncharacterized protein n=1 Tax=Phytohabitans flavus TaxID=1076124 RepID=A0A6F8XTK7_9ACTN|nr:hypothetical protein [Phytohabitans flavus]BCB77182.1 hypothetical protein Pflav_035920 [Phytohabitans flavus]
MDASGWARRAVTVANACPDTLTVLRYLLAEWPRRQQAATLNDLAAFRYAHGRLRQVFTAAAASRDTEAVDWVRWEVRVRQAADTVGFHPVADSLTLSGHCGQCA